MLKKYQSNTQSWCIKNVTEIKIDLIVSMYLSLWLNGTLLRQNKTHWNLLLLKSYYN